MSSTPLLPLSPLSDEWPAINALLDEALATPLAARAAWLEELARRHPTHGTLLRTLLGRQARLESQHFLDVLPQVAVEPETASDGLAPGLQIGPYRLLSELGRGGMGTVWRAERADGLVDRQVALKLPRAVWGVDFAERLASERRILASLEHEHIARLYDAGLDAQGRPYLAMEYVEGETIDAYCDRRALPLRQRLALILQVAAAVSHAHSKLVIHRDLKPGNILVTGAGQVKLLDFGIAKLLAGEHTDRSALTELSGRALTLDYASPEQIRGLPLRTSSDVYSLGVVLYELLAQARPYRLQRGSAAEIEDAIAHIDPPLASEAATDPALKSALRGDLDAILNHALKKAPDARYPSIEAFAQDIERYLLGQPVQARPDSRRYRLGKFVRRHRLGVAMGLALTVSLLGGAGVSLWQAQEAREQAARAEEEVEAQLAVRDLYMETMMDLSLTGVKTPEALARPRAIGAALQRKLAEIAPRFANKPSGRDAQLDAVALQLNYDGDFEGSLAVSRQYLDSLKAHAAPPHRIILAHAYIGRALFQLKRWDECEAIRRAGMDWAPEARDETTVLYRSLLISDLGSLLLSQGRRGEAERVLLHGQALIAEVFPKGKFTQLPQQLSALYLGFDDAKSLRYARQGHEALRGTPSADPDQRASDLLALGTALSANGLAAQAESVLSEALALWQASYPPDNKNVIRAATRLIGAISRQGDHARAAALLAAQRRTLAALPAGVTPYAETSLRAREAENAWLAGDVGSAATLAPSAPLDGSVIADSEFQRVAEAQLLTLAGRSGEALARLQTLSQRLPNAGWPTAAWLRVQTALATAQLSQGRLREALQTAQALSALLDQQQATTGGAYRSATELEALAAARQGDAAGAADALARADAINPAPPFSAPVERAESALRRAEVLRLLGRNDEAAKAGRAALADLATQRPGSPRLEQAQRLSIAR